MKWQATKKTKFAIGYTLAILAWFSFATIQGWDMLAYTKSNVSTLSKSASLHHK